MELIKFENSTYPKFQAEGYAAQFAIPYAKRVCKGKGYDIGCMKKEWAFPCAIPIDIAFDEEWEAYNLPDEEVDYIFSSHCLEHLENWILALRYWTDHIKVGGHLFLYLPDFSQVYWRPWNNKKHLHILSPYHIEIYLRELGYTNIFTAGTDLNNSFMIMAEYKGF